MEGAQYTVKYYAATSATGTPKATWVFQTDADGYTKYSNATFTSANNSKKPYKVSGPDLYVNAAGWPGFPAGTVTIQETKAPAGYKLNSEIKTYHFVLQDDGTVAPKETDLTWNTKNEVYESTYQSLEPPIYGGARFRKTDKQTGAAVNGATIAILNANGKTIDVNGKSYKDGAVILTVQTKKTKISGEYVNGIATVAKDALPVGKYKAVEQAAPSGYLLNHDWSVTFTISSEDGHHDNIQDFTADAKTLKNDKDYGGVKFKKIDLDTDDGNPPSGLTLENCRIMIYNANDFSVKSPTTGETKKAGKAIFSIYTKKVTDSKGKVSYIATTEGMTVTLPNGETSKDGCVLPCGKYYATEYEAPAGYKKNKSWKCEFEVTAGTITDMTKEVLGDHENPSVPSIYKVDSVTGDKPQGTANFKGCIFILVSNNSSVTDYNDGTFKKNQIMDVMVATKEGEVALHGKSLLPGEYKIIECCSDSSWKVGDTYSASSEKNGTSGEANSFYRIATDANRTQNVTASLVDGKITFSPDTIEIPNPIGRRGVKFTKKLKKADGSVENFAGIPFKLELLDENGLAVETHYLITNAKGVFNSESPANDVNTNANDAPMEAFFKKNPADAVIPEEVLAELSSGNGMWFGEGEVNGDRGGLIAGVYRLTELRCLKNEGCILTEKSFTITGNGGTLDLDQTDPVINKEIGIDTVALDQATRTHSASVSADTVIEDTVYLKNLTEVRKYRAEGSVYIVNEDGTVTELLDKKGEQIAAVGTVMTDTKGAAELTLRFPLSKLSKGTLDSLAGRTVVVYEEVYDDATDEYMISHKQAADTDQQVKFIAIGTTALDSETGDHISEADENITIVDTVSFSGLTVGKTYKLIGTLMDKATCEALLDDNGQEITAEKEFIAETAAGETVVTFTFSGVTLGGKTAVVFETLYYENIEAAVHADIEDEGQTVYIPEIHTTATDSETQDHLSKADEGITVTDRVYYSGLMTGKEYTVKGILMNKATGEHLLNDNGQEITAEESFTAAETEGYVDITFTFSGVSLAGTTAVAFETLYYENIEVAVHADIDDEDQTDYIPEIHTTALDKESQTHAADSRKDSTVVDTVYYSSLLPGKTYKVSGILMDKATGEALTDGNGYEYTAELEFTPETSEGSVELEFEVKKETLTGKTAVVFETLYYEDIEIAVHADIEDEDQTVYFPEIRTTAADSETGDHISHADEDITVNDTVIYSGLIPGKTYKVTGTLMDKATGRELLDDNGQKITAEKEFTAETAAGEVVITFTFSGVTLGGKTVVAFEKLYDEEREIAVHADIEDEDQTDYIPEIHTTAIAKDTEDHVTEANGCIVIDDTVSYEGLKPETEYTVKGVLMNAETGEIILDDNGAEVRAEKTFTTGRESSGETVIRFEFAGKTLAGTKTVVFETMYFADVKIAEHVDKDDEGQQITFPEIATTLTDKENGTDHAMDKTIVTLRDEVRYDHLLVGKTYTVSGYLVNKETGTVLTDAEGNRIEGSTTFTCETEKGSVFVDFTFDSLILHNAPVVAFEQLLYKDIEIAFHMDLNDEDQTDYVPEIHTTATDSETKAHVSRADEEITIIDKVFYTGLKPYTDYTVKGILMDKATGEALLDDNGQEIISEAGFTTGSADEGKHTVSGDVDVTFTFSGVTFGGKAATAFERLYVEGAEVAVHTDINDADQTVYFPEVHTTATDNETQDHMSLPTEEITINDTVFYTGLKSGEEYTIKGILMDKATGEALLDDNGQEITAEKTFRAETEEGFEDVSFTFSGEALSGKKLVVFEKLYYTEFEIASHEDKDDEDQSISFPDIHTEATDAKDGDHIILPEEDITVNDEVFYEGLIPGKIYTVKGTLMDKETGKALLNENGDAITAETTFTAQEANGSVSVIFTFKGVSLEGKAAVAFEELCYEKQKIAVHCDIDDEDQTVYSPVIKTTAKDSETQDHISKADENITIVDTVKYSGLKPGETYTVKGVLVDKKERLPLKDDNGQEIRAEKTFTAEEGKGSVDVTFTFSGMKLEGKTTVVFEEIWLGDVLVAEHKDLKDDGQTVKFPKARTTAVDEKTENHTAHVGKKVTIKDEVRYENLIPGKKYTVKGILMNKGTGKPLLDKDGNQITAEETFTAETESGSVEVKFVIDTTLLIGKKIVVFEEVYYEDVKVAAHCEIEDAEQTVIVPEIHTTATTDKMKESHTLVVKKFVKPEITDNVVFINLEAGKSYTLKGELMNKATGKSTGITAEKTFTAEAADGSAEVVFALEIGDITEESEYVVFEELFDEAGNRMAEHKDIEDSGQTVSAEIPKGKASASGPKGREASIPVILGISNETNRVMLHCWLILILLITVLMIWLLRKRKCRGRHRKNGEMLLLSGILLWMALSAPSSAADIQAEPDLKTVESEKQYIEYYTDADGTEEAHEDCGEPAFEAEITADGTAYRLLRVERHAEKLRNRKAEACVSVTRNAAFQGAAKENVRAELYTDPDSGTVKRNMNDDGRIPYTGSEILSSSWSGGDYHGSFSISGYDCTFFEYQGELLPVDENCPIAPEHYDLILKELGLDESSYRIEHVEYSGEAYTKDGVLKRDADVTFSVYDVICRDSYRGMIDIPDIECVYYTAVYEAAEPETDTDHENREEAEESAETAESPAETTAESCTVTDNETETAETAEKKRRFPAGREFIRAVSDFAATPAGKISIAAAVSLAVISGIFAALSVRKKKKEK